MTTWVEADLVGNAVITDGPVGLGLQRLVLVVAGIGAATKLEFPADGCGASETCMDEDIP